MSCLYAERKQQSTKGRGGFIPILLNFVHIKFHKIL